MDKAIVDIIKQAIQMERESQKLYMRLHKESGSRNGKVLFETLGTEEIKHEMILKEFLDLGNFNAAAAKVTTYNRPFTLFDKFMDPAMDGGTISGGLKLAVKDMRRSQKIFMTSYHNAQKAGAHSLIQNLFLRLYQEEKKHERIVVDEHIKMFGVWEE